MTSISVVDTISGARAVRRGLVRIGMSAAAVAGLGTWILYDARPGINWLLWTIAASAGLIRFAAHASRTSPHASSPPYAGRGPLGGSPPSRFPLPTFLSLACLLALGTAISANGVFQFWCAVGIVFLLSLALLMALGVSVESVGVALMATAPLRALHVAVTECARFGVETVGALRGERALPAVRGAVIALPILAVFAAMLAPTDPTLDSWARALNKLIASWEFVPRVVFFAVLLVPVVGAFSAASRTTRRPAFDASVPPVLRLTLGDTERLIVLGSVASLFGLFLVLQVSYLFGNAPAVRGSGVTFAEYARRGFVELTIVSTLCTLLILFLDRVASRGSREKRVRLIAMLLVGELQLLLHSAFHRVNLYERAYGFTTSRLYAQVYMIVAFLTLLLLAREVWGIIDTRRLARRVALLAVGAFASLAFWNHEAWIVQRNIDRFSATGKLDMSYLVHGLSSNALPALLGTLDRVPSNYADEFRRLVRIEQFGEERFEPESSRADWFEWNLRRAQADSALHASGIHAEVRKMIVEERENAARAAVLRAGMRPSG